MATFGLILACYDSVFNVLSDCSRKKILDHQFDAALIVFWCKVDDEIGRLLDVSERTARAHVGNIKEKLHASDRAAAVASGFENGILKA